MKSFSVLLGILVSAVAYGQDNRCSVHKGAVLAGDYPDPSIIRVGSTYYAAATSSQWAPVFPILKSKDLANWSVVGSVFPTPPEGTAGNYWAPELSEFNHQYYVYYVAQKAGGPLCVAVATADSPQGPYQDHGPLICQALGSIDPVPVTGNDGDRYLFWKEDGNSQNKPTPIYVQKLSADGTKLVGPMQEAIRNDPGSWEGNLVEAPYVMKHGEYWYLFYSANACCGLKCNYAMGVARSRDLMGPWEKNPQNPILKSNANWRCPGHGSIVNTGTKDFLLYHAYNRQDSVYVGRQMMMDEVEWGGDGWPTINQGQGPSQHLGGIEGHPLKNREHCYLDQFKKAKLDPNWQWPYFSRPVVQFDPGVPGITLSPSKLPAARNAVGAVLSRSTTTGNYVATTSLRVNDRTNGGISAFGNATNAVGLSYIQGKLQLWQVRDRKVTFLSGWPVPGIKQIALRMIARDGRYFRFEYQNEHREWTQIGGVVDGSFLPPWDLGIRVALVAGHTPDAEAHFDFFQIESR